MLNEKLLGWLRAFPARWVVRGENNRRGYVRRSCSVGLMDGGSIPPGSTSKILNNINILHVFLPALATRGADFPHPWICKVAAALNEFPYLKFWLPSLVSAADAHTGISTKLKQRLDSHKEWCHEYCDATRSVGRDAAPTRGN